MQISAGGPVVDVIVGVSIPRLGALQAAGLPIPQQKMGKFLIDTGASCTCIDIDLMNSLGIEPTGSTSIQTPSTNGTHHTCSLYDVMIFIPCPNANGFLVEAIPIVETHLSSQGIDGLIGRDILDKCTLIYNGTANMFSLNY